MSIGIKKGNWMVMIAMVAGAVSMGGLLCAIIWSVVYPQRRQWPVTETTVLNQTGVWGATLGGFVAMFSVGVLDWNSLGAPALPRWTFGSILMVAGNLLVWSEVFRIGWKATSGAAGELKTGGFYKYSRNPQYVADIGIIVGWAIMSSSLNVLPLAELGILVLALAPLAEEPWLAETYGAEYKTYKYSTPRYFEIRHKAV